eukprot:1101262-Prymnesium_polylepis.1
MLPQKRDAKVGVVPGGLELRQLCDILDQQVQDVYVATQAEECDKHREHVSEHASVLAGVVSSVVSDEGNKQRGEIFERHDRK